MKKGFQQKTNICRDINRETITCKEQVLRRWTQHFQYLLNEDEVTDRTLEEDIEARPTLREVKNAIKKMKNNKVPRHDNIIGELLKYGGEDVENMMLKIIHTMPVNWYTGVLCSLHKRG